MNFNLDEAIKTANQLIFNKFRKHLTDLQIIVFRGSWDKEVYDAIAARHDYSFCYIRSDVAPNLWNMLSESLGERVTKSNFKEALKRYWLQQPVFEETNEYWHNSVNNQNNTVSFISDTNLNLQESGCKNQPLIVNPKQYLSPEIYVERPTIESTCYQTIQKPGSLIRIEAPRFMGKTYLINKLLSEVSSQNYHAISLSFELADSAHFTNINKFLRWFCINLSRELGLSCELDKYWDEEGMGAKVSCTNYFEEYLLKALDAPLVLCLDDVDLLFPYPQIYEDFFCLLYSWYRKTRSRKIWKKLRLIIAHSNDVCTLLNIKKSPFNIGLPIELSEFTKEQVINFARQHQVLVNEDMFEQLMKLVGGHPYLLDLAFVHLKNYSSTSFNKFLIEATTEAGIYGHHLRELWLNLQQHPELTEAFKKAVGSSSPVRLEPMQAYQLYSMGLVKLCGNTVTPRCNLYRQFFGIHFENGNNNGK